ncbi:hypothetical protein HHY41_004373 [Salmonella enterica]|nr:hypothetical protein [Salmonella enterica]EBQ9480532.1 hypothetical protein [Salmonella enterica subsp. enterica serovar Kokomlemle]ECD3472119.1 hypothetical protein [Salmonella enterica subsp. enterica serovar Oranienburg]EDL5727705.1 hypothetical protein [Salmonella enterica subsp. enterica serovar Adelaide]EBA9765687.1 hypothetical protein [Salmonella enterica]
MPDNNKTSFPPFNDMLIEERISCLEIIIHSLVNSLDPVLNVDIIENLKADYERLNIEAETNSSDEERWRPVQNIYWSYLSKVIPGRNPGYED